MKSAILALIAWVFVNPAPAQAQIQNLTVIQLNPAIVQAFLKTMPKLRALGDKYEGIAPREGTPMASLEGMAISAAAKAELTTMLRSDGFGDYNTWTIVAQNILSTFTFIKMGDVKQQLSGAMAALAANPRLTAKQKADMAAQLGQTKTNTPSDNNIAVVGSMMGEIERTMMAQNQ